MSNGVRRESKATEKWAAWTGRVERLSRLAHAIEQSTAEYAAQMVEDHVARDAEGYGFLAPDKLDERLASTRSRAENEWSMEMVASRREFSTKYHGTPTEVLDAIDPATIVSVELIWPKRLYSPRTVAVRLAKDSGCRFEIAGDDPAWVRATHSTIVEGLRQGVPSWAWVSEYRRCTRRRIPCMGRSIHYLAGTRTSLCKLFGRTDRTFCLMF